MWEPQSLTNPWASTACYRDSFTFFLTLHPLTMCFFLENFSCALLCLFVRMNWCPVPVFSGLYYFHCTLCFNPANVVLLWPMAGSQLTFRIHEFHKAVTVLITSFITAQHNVTVCNVSKSWIPPWDTCVKECTWIRILKSPCRVAV
jgi:hypothetical protein